METNNDIVGLLNEDLLPLVSSMFPIDSEDLMKYLSIVDTMLNKTTLSLDHSLITLILEMMGHLSSLEHSTEWQRTRGASNIITTLDRILLMILNSSPIDNITVNSTVINALIIRNYGLETIDYTVNGSTVRIPHNTINANSKLSINIIIVL